MAAQQPIEADARSFRIARCVLTVGAGPWSFAERRRAEIAAHWKRSQAERPKLFDGTVYLLRSYSVGQGTLSGTLVRTDFKSFLYWRDRGYEDANMRDGFGSAVIRSAEGHVLLGQQSDGHLNAGLVYPPSGMIDERDDVGGVIDIEASIVRELGEETGLQPADLARVPGFVLTVSAPLLCIAIEWRSALPAEALRESILSHIRDQPAPELADIVIVRSRDEIYDRPMLAYAKSMLHFLVSA